MVPTPTPAPPMPMQAIPAPIIFAAVGSIRKLLFERSGASVARVDRIVEVDAGEDGEDVSLKYRDEQLKRSERNRQRQRQHGAYPPSNAPRGKEGDEAGEHLQRNVS